MKKYIILASILSIMAFGLIIRSSNAHANPSYFANYASSASATTTISYMTAGTATTTVSFDAQTGGSQAMDSASLFTQYTGSSTASILNIALEYSQDGIDWYSDTYNQATTSTVSLNTVRLDTPNSYSLTFASTTVGGVGGAGTRLMRVFKVATPTRFVRAIYTVPAGASAGGIYSQFIGKRETAF